MRFAAALVLLAGLAFIWRRDATADDEGEADTSLGAAAADALSGLATGDEGAGDAAEAVDLDVANNTSNTQNTVTIGNNTNAEVGGDLVLGRSPGGGLDSGGDAGGTGNTVNTEQNTVNIGNNSVLHVGSGRRPARSDDFAAFWEAHQLTGPHGNGNSANWLRNTGGMTSAGDFEATLNAQAASATWTDWLRARWNDFFGNAVAFPGQPIT